LHFRRTAAFRRDSRHRHAPDGGPDPVNIFVAKMKIDQSLVCRAGRRRDDGTTSTMTQSASIASPMNSNTNASTVTPRQTDRFVRKPLTVS
jgi:hypothetical protein